MAVTAFTDGRVYAGGVNLSGYANQAQMDLTAAELDASTISDDWDVTKLGRKRAAIDVTSFYEAGDGLPDALFDSLGVANQVVTLLPDGDDGGVGYSVQAVPVQHTIGGQSGELMTVQFSARGDISRAIRGTIMHDDSTARTADGNGTARQLGAVSSTQRVYAALHVVAYSGFTNVVVKVQSDDGVGMASATDRLTFSTMTTIGANWQSAAGAITDDWWRVNYDVTGTGSVTFVVVVAIH